VITHSSATDFYPLSLHDALPICRCGRRRGHGCSCVSRCFSAKIWWGLARGDAAELRRLCPTNQRVLKHLRLPPPRRHSRLRRRRSEEHTSELQSLAYLVCRLLLE